MVAWRKIFCKKWQKIGRSITAQFVIALLMVSIKCCMVDMADADAEACDELLLVLFSVEFIMQCCTICR